MGWVVGAPFVGGVLGTGGPVNAKRNEAKAEGVLEVVPRVVRARGLAPKKKATLNVHVAAEEKAFLESEAARISVTTTMALRMLIREKMREHELVTRPTTRTLSS